MSRIFDALRKAELEPNPFMEQTVTQGGLVARHPRRRRIFEREFGSLSNAVQGYFPRATSGKIVLVLGCVEGEGASYVSANLSRTLAKTSGAPILYMDGDYHSPGLQENFSSSPSFGLSDVVASGDLNSVSRAIHTADTTHLYILPGGKQRVSPSALFDSEDFMTIQTSLRRTFKYVIVDGPPVLKHPEALKLAAHVDGVVLVVRQGHLKREVVRKAIEQLQAVNAPLIGATLNRRRFAIPTLIYKLIS